MSTKTAKGAAAKDTLALAAYREVPRIRALELLLNRYVKEHGFGGFWHPGLGQEAVQARAVKGPRHEEHHFSPPRGPGVGVGRGDGAGGPARRPLRPPRRQRRRQGRRHRPLRRPRPRGSGT